MTASPSRRGRTAIWAWQVAALVAIGGVLSGWNAAGKPNSAATLAPPARRAAPGPPAATAPTWQAIRQNPAAYRGVTMACTAAIGGSMRLARPDALKKQLRTAVEPRMTTVACDLGDRGAVWLAAYVARGDSALFTHVHWQRELQVEVVGPYSPPAEDLVLPGFDPERQPEVVVLLRGAREVPTKTDDDDSGSRALAGALLNEKPWIGNSVVCRAGGAEVGVATAAVKAPKALASDGKPARYLSLYCGAPVRAWIAPERMADVDHIGGEFLKETTVALTILGVYDAPGCPRSALTCAGVEARLDGIVAERQDRAVLQLAVQAREDRFLGQRWKCSPEYAAMPQLVDAARAADLAQLPDGADAIFQRVHCYGFDRDERDLRGTIDVYFPPGRASESALIQPPYELAVTVRGRAVDGNLLVEYQGIGLRGLPLPDGAALVPFAEPQRYQGRRWTCVAPELHATNPDAARAAVARGQRIGIRCAGMDPRTHTHRFHVDFRGRLDTLPPILDLELETLSPLGFRATAVTVPAAAP